MLALSRLRSAGARPMGLMLLAALVAGCTGDQGSTSPRDAAASHDAAREVAQADVDQARPAKRLWARRLDVVGQPVQAAGSTLVLTRTPSGAMELVALETSSGAVRFRHSYHPGIVPTGVQMSPAVTETRAGVELVVLRPQEPVPGSTPVVAVTARTGREVARTELIVDDFHSCVGDVDVCVSGWSGDTDIYGNLAGNPPMHWNLTTGRIMPLVAPTGAIHVGDPGLYAGGAGRTARVSRVKRDETAAWTESTSLVIGAGVATKYGWTFSHDKKADVYVGALGKPVPRKLVRRFERGKTVSLALEERHLTVGIDGKTGKQLWRRPGADAWCDLVRSSSAVEPRTLCLVRGTEKHVKGQEVRLEDVSVTLEGIDPRTGETTWTHAISGRAARRAYVEKRVPLAPYGVVLQSEDGPVAVDQRDGSLEAVDPSTVLLCSAGPDTVTVYGKERVGGTLYQPCFPGGRRADAVPSEYGVRALEGEGEVRVVSMPGRVVAYRVR